MAIDRHLGCFRILAVVNKAAANMGEQISFRHLVFISFGFIPRREYYAATRTKAILHFATTRTDLEGVVLSEKSQTETDKLCMISLTGGILKN